MASVEQAGWQTGEVTLKLTQREAEILFTTLYVNVGGPRQGPRSAIEAVLDAFEDKGYVKRDDLVVNKNENFLYLGDPNTSDDGNREVTNALHDFVEQFLS